MNTESLFPPVRKSWQQLADRSIAPERMRLLDPIIRYGIASMAENGRLRINFICTHNSRRSQMAELWAQVFAATYGLPLEAASGGTTATRVHLQVLETWETLGFRVQEGKGAPSMLSIEAGPDLSLGPFTSKTYDRAFAAGQRYAAIMTCEQAAADCPFIPEAERRFSLPYEDPGRSDGRPEVAAVYRDTALQIGREVLEICRQLADRQSSSPTE